MDKDKMKDLRDNIITLVFRHTKGDENRNSYMVNENGLEEKVDKLLSDSHDSLTEQLEEYKLRITNSNAILFFEQKESYRKQLDVAVTALEDSTQTIEIAKHVCVEGNPKVTMSAQNTFNNQIRTNKLALSQIQTIRGKM